MLYEVSLISIFCLLSFFLSFYLFSLFTKNVMAVIIQIIFMISIIAFIGFIVLDFLHVLNASRYSFRLSLHIPLWIDNHGLRIDALFLTIIYMAFTSNPFSF